MSETEHPFDGKHYTSKSEFRKVTKAGGGVEVGNDPARFNRPERKPDRAGIRQSILKAKAQAGLS